MATLTNHRLAVGLELGLDYANSGNDKTLIDMRLNQAVRKVLRDTQCYVTSQTVTPGASQDYTLAAGVLDIVDLDFTASGQSYELERVTVPQLRRLRRQGALANPTRFYALAGNNTILFYPTPAASDAASMYYVPAPTAMSSGTHDSSSVSPTNYGGVPEDYDHLIQFWALHLLASFDDDQSSAQGKRYLDLYREGVKEARGELRRKGGHRRPKIVPGRYGTVRGSRGADASPW